MYDTLTDSHDLPDGYTAELHYDPDAGGAVFYGAPDPHPYPTADGR